MTGPANSTTDRWGNRTYTWKGEAFQSVTTLLRALPKPALVSWAGRTVAEAAVAATQDGTLTTMVEADPAGAVAYLKQSPYTKRDTAADGGSWIHRVIEAHILGAQTPAYPVTVRPQIETFLQFESEYAPGWEASEVTVYNRRRQYAGTLDAIATIGGRRLLIDVKTGKAIYPDYALQLAAYRHAEFIGLPDGTEHPLPTIDGAAVLHIRPRGFELREVNVTDEIFRTFLYVSQVRRWETDISKRALLTPIGPPRSEQDLLAFFNPEGAA